MSTISDLQIVPARVVPITLTTDQWAYETGILRLGEIGIEVEPSGLIKWKFGNGTSLWSALPYNTATGSGAFVGVAVPATSPPFFSSNAYYLVNTPGSYTNFPTDGVGGYIVVPSNNLLGIVSYDTVSGFWTYTEVVTNTALGYGTLDQTLTAGNTSGEDIVLTNGIGGSGNATTDLSYSFIQVANQVGSIIKTAQLNVFGLKYAAQAYSILVQFPLAPSRNTGLTFPQRDGELAIVNDITLDKAIAANNTTNRSAIWTNGTSNTLNISRSGVLIYLTPSAGNSDQMIVQSNSIYYTKIVSSVSKSMKIGFGTLLNSLTTLFFPGWRNGTLALAGDGVAPIVYLVGDGLGTGGTAVLQSGSDDVSGVITVVSGTSPVSGGDICTIKFNTEYPKDCRVQVQISSDITVIASTFVGLYVDNLSGQVASFIIRQQSASLIPTGGTFKISYIVTS